ncbi:MAG: hypothetical protein ACOC2U_05625 [bacterium]
MMEAVRLKSFFNVLLIFVSLQFLGIKLCYSQEANDNSSDTNVIYIYDTVKHEKVIYEYDTTWISKRKAADIQKIKNKELESVCLKQENQIFGLIPDSILYEDMILSPEKGGIPIKNFFNIETGIFSPYSAYLNSSETDLFLEQYKQSTSPVIAGNIGLTYLRRQKQLHFGIGIYYLQYIQSVDFPEIKRVDDNSYYDVYTGGYWVKDTVETYYQYNGSDTTWYYITDDRWVETTDSFYIEQIDTVILRNSHQSHNYFTYLEIPFSFGYSFLNTVPWDISIYSELITSILINTKGSTIISGQPDKYSKQKINSLKKIVFFYSIGLRVSYKFNQSSGIYLQPGFRQSIEYQNILHPSVKERFSLPGIKGGVFIGF